MKISYKSHNGIQCVLDLDYIITLTNNGDKIALIKEYRNITGKGLKDSKDIIEDALYNHKNMVDLFRKATGHFIEPYTKEEFMNVIENAIDNMHHLQFDDMLSAVEIALDNIKKRGGLKALAMERNNFLEAI